jgi:hypothetical protein
MAKRKSETAATAGIAIGFSFGDGMREPVAPESFNRSQSRPNLRFANLVEFGENPNGFTSITPNGVGHDNGLGHNQDRWGWSNKANGERWSGQNLDWAKRGGNRTGE